MDYSRALDALTQWAQGRDDVRALVLTGSAAAESAHSLSDRDIEVFTTDIDALLRDESWWSGLGDVLVVERLQDGDGNPTRLIYYAGGKIDFTLLPANRLAGRDYARPFRALLDKDGLACDCFTVHALAAATLGAEFEESVNWAWAAALMQAKAIVRDEPWSAKLRDQDLKAELLRMIEWDHLARHGAGLATRYLGTRMRQWMDTDIQHALEQCWGGLDGDASARALLATTDLYRALAKRTATALDLPQFDHERVETEMHTILSLRST